jgi:FixJ family two-component response regulator
MNYHGVAGLTRSSDSGLTPTVFVVDPDSSVRSSLEALISREGWLPRTLASAEDFDVERCASRPSCLVSEVSLPGLSGLGLQERLAGRPDIPVIFLANMADVSTTVAAMRAGAVELLIKPFRDDILLTAIRTALELSCTAILQQVQLQTCCEHYATLSRREREVMALVVVGLLNKQIAGELAISEITVKAHRGKVMHKMGARSLAQLVAIAAQLGVVSLSRSVSASTSVWVRSASQFEAGQAGAFP